jgi:hypothetical protein
MDNNGQPDPKRPRTQAPPPHHFNNRALPTPQPQGSYNGHNGLPQYTRNEPHSVDRRHSEHNTAQPYEHDPSRPRSGPHPPYHPPLSQAPPQHTAYGGQQRDGAMVVKRELEDAGATQYRPPSTGGGHENHGTPEGGYPGPPLPPFNMAQHPPGPQHPPPGQQPYRQASFPAPQSPMHGNEPYGHPSYQHQSLPPPRDNNSVSYPPVAPGVIPPKRKAQRASQACDMCRSLKAKCDEARPCASCYEKNIPCKYRDPPPKPYVSTVDT